MCSSDLFNAERIDPDLFKKSLPAFFLLLAISETLLNQFHIELRFSLNCFPFLHFPKTGLLRACFRQCLPEFVTPENVDELKARKGISQKIEIGCFRFAERVSRTQTTEKIVQVPTHQLKTEDFV